MPTQEYPIWVCDDCGETKMVTEPRDFGHLKPTWKEDEK